MNARRERALDALVLVGAKLLIGAWVLRLGFTHVSDDDYARTVIAEQMAHAPRLDPSGTSWLPLPFWVEGLTMMVAGRTLGVARGVAMVLGAVSVAAPYLAMRAMGVRRVAALAGAGVAMALPWDAWLGVATVPEGWFGAVVAAGMMGMARAEARAWASLALGAASLARYEVWPVCALMVVLCACSARRPEGRTRELVCAAVAAAGPALWMAWNAHAHGSALHFVSRVTTFRHAIGAADVPLADKLLGYPRALVLETPEVALLGAAGLVGLGAARELRARWRWPAAATALMLACLVWGDVRDGAPTHHPVRALTATWWILAGMGADAVVTLLTRVTRTPRLAASRRGALVAPCVVAAAAWAAWLPGRWRDAPGESDAERRDGIIARGLEMRDRGVTAAEVTPCAFEHFALLAAWGEPERATVAPRTGAPLTSDCPRVVER